MTLLVLALGSGCVHPQATTPTVETPGTDQMAMSLAPVAGLPGPAAKGAPVLLGLLVPDGQNMADPQVKAWVEAAAEVGARLQPVTDAQFLRLSPAAGGFAGLILPDGLHTQASDALISAIVSYTRNGGRTMLVFDFGALTLKKGVPVYAVPKSRLSALAGVDYVLYDALRERTTGLGPVRAMRHTMRQLGVPPGRSMAYVPARPAPARATPSTTVVTLASLDRSASSLGLRKEAEVAIASAVPFLPGTGAVAEAAAVPPSAGLRDAGLAEPGGDAAAASAVNVDFDATPPARPETGVVQVAAGPAPSESLAARDVVEAYSWNQAYQTYPTYVTQGPFGGTRHPGQLALADSPQFGLVAGVNPVGAGKVLFVNLPLTYLKGRMDPVPMHGFLSYFTHNLLNGARSER